MAEDVVQESLAYLWTRLDTYDPKRGSIGQWLGKCVGNRVRNANRDRQNRSRLDDWDLGLGITLPTQEANLRVNYVLDQVSRMTGKMREVMELFVMGLRGREIEKGLGISPKTAQYWLDKGLAKLRKRVR
jgi:RNA polymerase sigma factor (sigma-70 family)